MKSLVLAGGCFWGVEAYLKQFDGILHTEVGYANGPTIEPTYEQVCNASGHAEAVMVHYNSEVITTAQLIDKFFDIINPTSINQQGNDIGIQYRTGIYYEHGNQMAIFIHFYTLAVLIFKTLTFIQRLDKCHASFHIIIVIGIHNVTIIIHNCRKYFIRLNRSLRINYNRIMCIKKLRIGKLMQMLKHGTISHIMSVNQSIKIS